jgi:hypothetical protein
MPRPLALFALDIFLTGSQIYAQSNLDHDTPIYASALLG